MLNNFFYNSVLVNKFINKCFKKGKKEKFEVLLYKAFISLSKKLKIPIIFFFFEILEKQKPLFGNKSYFKKKKKTFIPTVIKLHQQYLISVQLVIKSINANSNYSLLRRLSVTLFNYFSNSKLLFLKGMNLKKEMYSIALKNRPIKHFRWK